MPDSCETNGSASDDRPAEQLREELASLRSLVRMLPFPEDVLAGPPGSPVVLRALSHLLLLQSLDGEGIPYHTRYLMGWCSGAMRAAAQRQESAASDQRVVEAAMRQAEAEKDRRAGIETLVGDLATLLIGERVLPSGQAVSAEEMLGHLIKQWSPARDGSPTPA